MKKLMIAVASAISLLAAVGVAWQADATPFAATQPPTSNYSPIEKVGCGGPGRCPWGRYWACGPYRCGCVACVARPYVYRPFVVRPGVRIRVW